ncbi:NUDIX hydrolase [Trueperella bialowiezensis]|uniref:Putative NUDIX hydrolase n=1 Tax=Trueperella bialowiezensis TaxID=312285 RepID=A0A448PF31_9ACTO|nr:CoA pyrophosphatase [Trueperella bialowiezensis]VEI13555.1 putative NUDIX hydrolase [Trueperella bialowiezensis]
MFSQLHSALTRDDGPAAEQVARLAPGSAGLSRDSSLEGAAAGGAMRKAAVLILLTDEPDPRVLFTVRASHLRKHPGQVSFPGGSRDGAETPEQTALREAWEECGIAPGSVHVGGRLPASVLPVTSFAVTPVVGLWQGGLPIDAVADPAEVAEIFTAPVSALTDPEHRGIWRFPDPRFPEPAAQSSPKSGASLSTTPNARRRHEGPAFVHGEFVIWGFTAMLLDGLLDVAGWARPWDSTRIIDVPERFSR